MTSVGGSTFGVQLYSSLLLVSPRRLSCKFNRILSNIYIPDKCHLKETLNSEGSVNQRRGLGSDREQKKHLFEQKDCDPGGAESGRNPSCALRRTKKGRVL